MKQWSKALLSLALAMLIACSGLVAAADTAEPAFDSSGYMMVVAEPEAGAPSLVFYRGGKAVDAADLPWEESEHGQSIRLNGEDEYLSLPLETLALQRFTLSMWVYWDGNTDENGVVSADNQTLFSLAGGTRNAPTSITLSPAEAGEGEALAMQVHVRQPAAMDLRHDAALPAGSWQHVVMVFTNVEETTMEVSVFLNDESEPIMAGDMTATMADFQFTDLFVGKGPTADAGYFSGLIDDVCLYNRVLNANERAALYRAYVEQPETPLSSTPQANATTVAAMPLETDTSLPPIPPAVWIVGGAVLLAGAALMVYVNMYRRDDND